MADLIQPLKQRIGNQTQDLQATKVAMHAERISLQALRTEIEEQSQKLQNLQIFQDRLTAVES